MQVRSADNYKNISRYEFDNGLVLLAKPAPGLPIISFRGCIRGGALLEKDDQSGLTKMLCLLLKAGTPNRSAVAIADELDFMGTSLTFSPHYDAVYFSLSCLSKYFKQSLDTAADLLFRSEFPKTEIDRVRRTALAALKRKADQPAQVAADRFNESVYQGHLYRFSLDGYEQTLEGFTRDDFLSHHKKIITPQNIILTAAGDFDTKKLFNVIHRHFDLRAIKTEPSKETEVKQNHLNETHFIPRDITQANICMGNTASKRKSEDHYASMLMNYILGGSGLTSRLTHKIRTQQGLAYSVYSAMSHRLLGGSFSVRMQTKNANAGHAVQTIREELRRMQNILVTDDEIRDAKNFFKGHFPFRIETVENEASYIEMSEFYQLGLDYLDKETGHIDNVTKEDIQTAARKYLNPDSFVLSVAGKKAELENQFKDR